MKKVFELTLLLAFGARQFESTEQSNAAAGGGSITKFGSVSVVPALKMQKPVRIFTGDERTGSHLTPPSRAHSQLRDQHRKRRLWSYASSSRAWGVRHTDQWCAFLSRHEGEIPCLEAELPMPGESTWSIWYFHCLRKHSYRWRAEVYPYAAPRLPRSGPQKALHYRNILSRALRGTVTAILLGVFLRRLQDSVHWATNKLRRSLVPKFYVCSLKRQDE